MVEAPEVPNLATLADKIQDTFKLLKLTGYPRVSSVHPAPVTALADWEVCLRANDETNPLTYALFLQRNDVVDYRLALPIDQCSAGPFGALPIQQLK
jgi:hypothetical protein